MKKRFLIPSVVITMGVLSFVAYCRVAHRGKGFTLAGSKLAVSGIMPEPVQLWTVPEGAAYTAEILANLGKPDLILEYYQDEFRRQEILAFFGALAQSDKIAQLILDNAAVFRISPSLAFALCWKESRFNPWAVNQANRNSSIDRGLFQLNNRSFPKLSEEDFFNPALNVYYGMAHLRWCLDSVDTEVAALAMYNAGHTRVSSGATPKQTLDYVSGILEFRRGIEDLFRTEYLQREKRDYNEILISRSPR